MSKTDMQLKQDVEDELRWDPKVNAAQIGVTVDQGAVSLMGGVDTYAQKWAAEAAAKRVGGVRSLAEDLTVKVLGTHERNDSEIAEAALNALKWDVYVPKSVTANIQHGRIALEGEVEWKYQRDAAERSVRYLTGVVSVANNIHIKSNVSAAQVKEKVQAALQRQASVDANTIQVDTHGGTVTLSGNASSWRAIDYAADAAWAAPGVTNVVQNVHMTGY